MSDKRYSAGEALEAFFAEEGSHDKQFTCGSVVEMVVDNEESDDDSKLDTQIVQIISNFNWHYTKGPQTAVL